MSKGKFVSDTKLHTEEYKNIDAPESQEVDEQATKKRNLTLQTILLSLCHLTVKIYNIMDYQDKQSGKINTENESKWNSLLGEIQKASEQETMQVESFSAIDSSSEAISMTHELYKWLNKVIELIDQNQHIIAPKDQAFFNIGKYQSAGEMNDQTVCLTSEQEMKMELAKLGAKVSKLSKGRYENQRAPPPDYKGLNGLIDAISKMQQRSYENQRYEMGPKQQYVHFVDHISKMIVKGNSRRLVNQDFVSKTELRRQDISEVEETIYKLQSKSNDNQRYQMRDEKEKELFFINIMKKMAKHDEAYDNQRSLSPESLKQKKLDEIESTVMRLTSMGMQMDNQRCARKEGLIK